MKTLQQIIDALSAKNAWERESCELLDSRDISRLVHYMTPNQMESFGFSVKEGVDYAPGEFTLEAVMLQMKADLDFAFEKAINHRGISSNLMHDVMRMWMWILEDDLANYSRYDPYGLPLYSKIAVKYNLPDRGDEYRDDE